jgi:SAM-dependent methyltransferase
MQVPLASAAVDGVLCHLALMDIAGLEPTVRGVARILRPGGWFVFSITHPCIKSPATGEITDHVHGSVRRTVGRYFNEGHWDGPGAHAATLPVGAYHRIPEQLRELAGRSRLADRPAHRAGRGARCTRLAPGALPAVRQVHGDGTKAEPGSAVTASAVT